VTDPTPKIFPLGRLRFRSSPPGRARSSTPHCKTRSRGSNARDRTGGSNPRHKQTDASSELIKSTTGKKKAAPYGATLFKEAKWRESEETRFDAAPGSEADRVRCQ